LTAHQKNIFLNSCIRVKGNQIARQRQTLVDYWYDSVDSDWLFFIDSDININLEIFKKICDTADRKKYPIVSGVYFISKESKGSLPIIMPCIFDDIDQNKIMYHHPLPENKVIKVDCAGMGLVIIHRDVITKLRKKYGKNNFLFAETALSGDDFVGEDIAFFRKCKEAKIPVYANTAAVAKHMKKVAWDLDYYNLTLNHTI